MALIVADMPRFSIENDDDLDSYIHLYRGYLNTVGIDPNGAAGAPTGRDRAMGVLRSGLQGSAAEWFDENIVGKNWKLKYFITNGGANMAALRALAVPQNAVAGLHVGSLVAGSPADAYSREPVNAAATVGQAFIPNHDMLGGDTEWIRIGAEPSGDPVNATNANNGQPIVLPGIRAHQAVSYMRSKLPSIINEKRKLELHRLFQGSSPIRVYWKNVQRAGRLLKLPQEVIDDHFYKGLSADNSDDVDRLDPEYSVPKVVEILDKLEKRRLERIDYPKRERQDRFGIRNVIPVEAPPVVSQQEPAEIRKIAPQAIAQEHIDRIVGTRLDKVTKEFQDQIQNLQNIIAQTQQKAAQPEPPQLKTYPPLTVKPMTLHEYTERDKREQNQSFDDIEKIMGTNLRVNQIAQRVAKRLARAEEKRQDRELARAMQGLDIDDRYPEPMDTSNLVRVGDAEVDEDDLNVYITNLIRSQKKR